LGVTRNIPSEPQRVVFWASPLHAPYIKTKPIHGSQQIVEEVKGGTHFSIDVVPNFELERELIGFGEGLKVLSPNSLVRQIKKRIKLMVELYGAN
jgi:predicted DNA-binding transcriptional regulator YafY